MQQELVIVATFSSVHEALLAKASLEAAGIPACTADEHLISAAPYYSNALGGVKVLAPASFWREARAILAGSQNLDDHGLGDDVPVAEHQDGGNRKPWVRFLVWLWLLLVAVTLIIVLFQP
jgi:hypothetical protein